MTYRIIPRVDSYGEPCLFFPDDTWTSPRGATMGHYCESEGHSMASLGYYRTTSKANFAALKLARKYAKGIKGARIMQRITYKKEYTK